MQKVFILLFLFVSFHSDAQHLYGLDPTFATNGIYMGDTGAVLKMAVQTDGKIIVIEGEAKQGKQTMAMRFKTDGSIDSSFAQNGRFLKPLNLGNASIVALSLQTDGKIVIAGTVDTGSTLSDFLILRLKTDGNLDSSFGGGGYVINSLFNIPDTLASIALQQDGKIVAYGYFHIGEDTLQVIRYQVNGSLDSSFGLHGRVKLYEGFSNPIPNNIAVTPEGKIVVGCGARINTLNDAAAFTAIRLLANGDLDTSFNHTGVAYSDLNLSSPSLLPSHYHCTSMKLQTDGKVLLAGHVYIDDPNSIFTTIYDTAIIARFDNAGNLDNSFGSNGLAGLANRTNELTDMLVQPDGKIIIATYFKPYIFPFNPSYLIYRVLSNGTIDSSVSAAGYPGLMVVKSSSWTGLGCKAWSIFLQQDGKLLVGGYQDFALHMARYLETTATVSNVNDHSSEIIFYPNPAKETIYFDRNPSQNVISINLYSVDGKLIHSLKTTSNSISTEGLSDGIYYLKLSLSNHQHIAKKIIIKKN